MFTHDEDCDCWNCEGGSYMPASPKYVCGRADELISILEVTIARGEALGYEDDDYRQLLKQLTND